MKKSNQKPKLQKVRLLTNRTEYYTYSHWEPKMIDGQAYLPVNKFVSGENDLREIHYVRKDSVEYVK